MSGLGSGRRCDKRHGLNAIKVVFVENGRIEWKKAALTEPGQKIIADRPTVEDSKRWGEGGIWWRAPRSRTIARAW